ncbi:MAG TPA: AmmeMemoRadiSam system protein B [Clostridia bacterium]|nr:AmmeMemoRadiSam system protein B [Clostridia bacterium]
MRTQSALLMVVLAVVLGITAFMTGCEGQIEAKPEKVPAHPCRFYNERDFFESLSKSGSEPADVRIRGGIVPHHLVAGYMIADFFGILSGREVERVIVVGPNHYLKGARVTSSRYNWQTPFGILKTDTVLVDELTGSGIAGADEDAIASEHSIAAIVPYIKYYLPDSSIVPIILHPDLTEREAENLADLLLQNTGDRDVLVASVDFSHYLTEEEAMQRDTVTLKAIEERDYARLLKMGDEYLDSPPSLVTLMKAMDKAGAGSMKVLHHSNSARILERDLEETTSYFTLIYQ